MKNQLDKELSLVSIMKSDPKFSERIQQVSKKIKKDKNSVLTMADKYSRKYQREIEEGTEQEKLLLTEGARAGYSRQETMTRYGRFLPTVRTPILNWLYFFMEEEKDDKQDRLREGYNKQYGHFEHKEEEFNSQDVEDAPEMMEYLYGNLTLDMFNKLKKLKALSKSSNENEAFRAYRACLRLCEKYRLEFDKIPG